MAESRIDFIKSWNEKANNEKDIVDRFMCRCITLSALCQTWSALESPSNIGKDDGYVVKDLFKYFYKNIDCFRSDDVIASFRELVNGKALDGSQVIGKEETSRTNLNDLNGSADILVDWLNKSSHPNYDVNFKKRVAEAFAVIVREVRNNLFHGKKGHKIDRDRELIKNTEQLLDVFITPIIADLDRKYS